jgi:hypothetical protein
MITCSYINNIEHLGGDISHFNIIISNIRVLQNIKVKQKLIKVHYKSLKYSKEL